jgi:hypothetical protein
MSRQKNLLVPLAISLGVLLLAVAIVYWVDSAGSLPSFFPGHEDGSTDHHVKHGIAALVVALACFAYAWFATGPSSDRAD